MKEQAAPVKWHPQVLGGTLSHCYLVLPLPTSYPATEAWVIQVEAPLPQRSRNKCWWYSCFLTYGTEFSFLQSFLTNLIKVELKHTSPICVRIFIYENFNTSFKILKLFQLSLPPHPPEWMKESNHAVNRTHWWYGEFSTQWTYVGPICAIMVRWNCSLGFITNDPQYMQTPFCFSLCDCLNMIRVGEYKYHRLTVKCHESGTVTLGQLSRYVTRYGLDGPGSKSRWGQRFSAPVEAEPGVDPAPCTMGTRSLFPGVNRPERGVDHPPPSSTEVKRRVDLYLSPPLCLHGLL